MNRITIISVLGALILFSCDGLKDKKQNAQIIQNQLVVTSEGDTLENGFWTYEMGVGGVAARGNYTDGFKISEWTYKTNFDSVRITWDVFNQNGVKFNFPNYLKRIDSIEPPALFQADVEDNDDNTYVVLLRYNLKELNSSIYDYLYQGKHSWENNPNELLKSEEYKKFTFREFEIFRAKVETERKIKYEAISYIFVVNNFLYDLTYKRRLDKSSEIDLEVFNDILYSMECDNVDLFNHYNRKYSTEADVEVK